MEAMTQEDGFVEVLAYLPNKTPIIKWVRPVKAKKLRLLYDVWALMAVATESDLDFQAVEQMEPDEYMAWMLYGGYMSYQAKRGKRPSVTIDTAIQWMDGIMQRDRLRIIETIQQSKKIGRLADNYQKAKAKLSGVDEEGSGKKPQGNGSGQMN